MRFSIAVLSLFGFLLGNNAALADLNAGLIVHFPFDGNTDDVSGNGNHGTAFGPTLTSDRHGNPSSAYLFDGIDDYIGTATQTWGFDTTASVVAWFKPSSTIDSGIVSLNHDFVQDELLLMIRQGKVGIYNHKSNGNFVERKSNTPMSNDTWYFVVGQLNGGGECGNLHIFVDGLEETGTCHDAGGSDIVDTIPRQLLVGARADTGWKAFSGVIDDVRIYDRVLSIAEIQTLYSASPEEPEDCYDNVDTDGDGLSDEEDPDCNFLVSPIHGFSPYDAPVIAIFDHHYENDETSASIHTPGLFAGMPGTGFGRDQSEVDGFVVAFNGEEGEQDGSNVIWPENPEQGKPVCIGNNPDGALSGPYLSGLMYTNKPGVLCYDGHRGTDFKASEGEPVYPAMDGQIVFLGCGCTTIDINTTCLESCEDGPGNFVAIQHPNGYLTYYLHLSAFGPFPVGTMVTIDDMIGEVGKSGGANGNPHLHFEVGASDTMLVDPYGYNNAGDLWISPCEDGIDNDDDGDIDMDDESCTSPTDRTEFEIQPACADRYDNDGDGRANTDDPGCASIHDVSERSPLLPCDDGIDNDGDGRIDFDPVTFANPGDLNTMPAGIGDPGCKNPSWSREDPACQNGIDDPDLDMAIDYDGGRSVNGSPDPVGADPHCLGKPWRDKEKAGFCGLGFELALLLAPIAAARGRRRVRG